VIIVELGLVIPPIGLVILIINGMRPEHSPAGALPAHHSVRRRRLNRAGTADAFPVLALWLPSMLHGLRFELSPVRSSNSVHIKHKPLRGTNEQNGKSKRASIDT